MLGYFFELLVELNCCLIYMSWTPLHWTWFSYVFVFLHLTKMYVIGYEQYSVLIFKYILFHFAVLISPYLYKGFPVPVIPQPEILSSVAYNPITVWTTSNRPLSPLPNDLSPISGYPSSLGRVSPPPLSDTSSKDHSGSESPISDEDERIHTKLTDPHAETEKFQCSLCNKSYSTYSGLLKHKQLHCDAQTRKSFSCKYCEKEYVSLGALKMHIRTHTLPCVCKICGKAFSRPWLLQGHIRTHTGEKPFSCPHCSRAFADRSNLRAHLQTHSDVKKYQCKNCSKTFSRMSLLHKHEESGCCVAHWDGISNRDLYYSSGGYNEVL